LTLRLPSLLGGLLYLLSAFALARRLILSAWLQFLTVALLALDANLLDHMSAARGTAWASDFFSPRCFSCFEPLTRRQRETHRFHLDVCSPAARESGCPPPPTSRTLCRGGVRDRFGSKSSLPIGPGNPYPDNARLAWLVRLSQPYHLHWLGWRPSPQDEIESILCGHALAERSRGFHTESQLPSARGFGWLVVASHLGFRIPQSAPYLPTRGARAGRPVHTPSPRSPKRQSPLSPGGEGLSFLGAGMFLTLGLMVAGRLLCGIRYPKRAWDFCGHR